MLRLDPPKTYFLVIGFAQDTPNVFEIGMAFPVRRSKTKRKSQPSRSAPFYDSYTSLFNQFKIDGELKKGHKYKHGADLWESEASMKSDRR